MFAGVGRCELCHSGTTFSDGEFHNIGLPGTVDLIPHLTDPQKADLVAFLKTLNGVPVPRALTEPLSR